MFGRSDRGARRPSGGRPDTPGRSAFRATSRAIPVLVGLAAVPVPGLAGDGVVLSRENLNLIRSDTDYAIQVLSERLFELSPQGRLTRPGFDYATRAAMARGRAWRASELLAYDLDADGALSAEEILGHRAFASDARRDALDAILTAADLDGDGALSADEVAAEADRTLIRDWSFAEDLLLMDADGDGAVTPDDIAAFVRAYPSAP